MSLIAPRRAPRRLLLAGVLLLGLLVGGGVFQYVRPARPVVARQLVSLSSTAQGTAPVLPWPAKGAGAVAATDVGLLGTGGSAAPQSMYSVAKIMTALAILEDKPLRPGEQGPTITVDAADVAVYQQRLAAGESVVKVQAGEQLSEYQALQGLLIPSGNNIGVLLSRWDAGSEAAMVVKLNAKARALKLTRTTFDDVSGASTKTQSVPAELVVLGGLAIKDPLIAGIVSQVQAVLPVAGVVYNVDYALGQENIVGIKTGSSPDGFANFVFASSHSVDGRPVLILGAVMGLSTLDEAFAAGKALIVAVRPHLQLRHVLVQGQAVARYQAPWGSRTDVVAQQGIDLLAWPGLVLRTTYTARTVDPPQAAGSQVGVFSAKLGDQALESPLVTAAPLVKPGARYKLTRSDF